MNMFKSSPPCLFRILCYNQRRLKSDYNIFAAVCLERQPLIAPELNIIERTLKQYLARVDDIQSIYSDHEMRHMEDLKRAERLSTQTNVDEKDVEAATKQTAQDFEDQCQRQLAQFKFGPKTLGSAVETNLKSLDRRLDRRLLLLTQIKLGRDFKWILPASEVKPSETLIQAAERTLDDCFPKSSLQAKFLSTAPTAVYKYSYPMNLKTDGKKGARMFIFKSFLKSGTIKEDNVNKDLIQDYSWLTRDEARELMEKEKQQSYWRSLSRSFLDESISVDTIKMILRRVRRNVTRENEDLAIEIKQN